MSRCCHPPFVMIPPSTYGSAEYLESHILIEYRFRVLSMYDQKEVFKPPSHLFSCCPFHPTLSRCARKVDLCADTVIAWRSTDRQIISPVYIPYHVSLAEYFFFIPCHSTLILEIRIGIDSKGWHWPRKRYKPTLVMQINPTVEAWVRRWIR